MNKEKILTFIDKDFTTKGTIYFENIPSQIGNAIYNFGSNDIKDIIAFIDCSVNLDGSLGLIITSEKIYFQLDMRGSFSYQDIIKLELNNSKATALVTTKDNQYAFNNNFLNEKRFIKLLATVTNLEIDMILTNHEKVAYYIPIILKDLLNDEYEDILLTDQQQKKINDFFQDLELINKLNQDNYQIELELICTQALNFFNELELDSDEIDILIELQEQFNERKKQEDQMFDGAKQYYDDMMNKYQEGDTTMFSQMKGMMQNLGINENELEGKSPAESNQYLEDLCARFGISKSQVENLAKKFKS